MSPPSHAPERRRRAPRAIRTTDVTRFRGVLVAAVVGALVVMALALLASDRDARRGSPGPLARWHREAALTCAACHGAEHATPAAACVACHGPHPPALATRPAHHRLAEDGALTCTACHRGHGTAGGVALGTDGRAIRFAGARDAAAVTTDFQPRAAITVPLIPIASCARCHDPTAPRDPIARCVLAGPPGPAAAGPSVCFDEHRAIRDAAGFIAPRSAAWDAAREVAAITTAPPTDAAHHGAPWWWLGVAGVVAALTWAAVGVVERARLRRRAAAIPAAPPLTSTALRRLPVIDTATCLGCHACVDACPFDVLEVRRYVAVVARPADCCGLTLCEQRCPNQALVMGEPSADAAPAIALADSLEARAVPGLFLAGDVTGQSLIRTAIQHGVHAIAQIAARPGRASGDGLDVVIVGAGPAGLAAALEAKARGLRALALEQATVVDSIRSFPRGKLVADANQPPVGPLWLAEATKEELLARWTQTVRRERPAIREGARVTAIAPQPGGGFVVDAVDAGGASSSHRAAHVVLAIGRRGSPRRLDVEVPVAVADHVHYSLADARSFAGRRILVVGLGDVAMEAAVALARQPGTQVVVSYRGADFQRGKARNIAELRRQVAAGAIRVVWQSEVTGLAPGQAQLATPGGAAWVDADSVFVLIGSIPAEGLLRALGLLGGH